MLQTKISMLSIAALVLCIGGAGVARAQTSVTCTPPPSGMISWWPGEGDAKDIADGNDGTLEGGVTFAPGKVGQAFFFNGTTADVKVPSASNLNVGTGPGLTIDLWIDPTTVATSQPLVEWNPGVPREGSHFWISVFSTGDLFANLIDTSNVNHIINSGAGVITAGTFQHVAVTYDKASGIATLYRNGAIVAGPTNLGTFTPQTSFDLYFAVRVAGDAPLNHYGGLLDEIELFNRALSQAEIQAIFNADSAGKCHQLDTFQVNYFAGANGARPDQTVRITNPGTAAAGGATQDLCANIYVFRNDQQLAECCSCLVTPNGLRTLSVDFDLAHNALTPGAIGEGVIKIVSSPVPTGGCTPAAAASGHGPVPALRAWGTHNQDVSGGLQGSAINQVTETHFLDATLSPAELRELQTNCAFINSQGSGHGICLCGRGD